MEGTWGYVSVSVLDFLEGQASGLERRPVIVLTSLGFRPAHQRQDEEKD